MLNFIGYMVFSSFEYCGIILLMISIFKIDIKLYKKEFLSTVFFVTLISYFITILDSRFVIVVVAPILILSIKFLFEQKVGRTIIIVLGGLGIYLAMQSIINLFAVYYNYLNVSDLQSPFGIKTYVMQTLSSVVAISISIYLRIFNGGFGFSLRSKKRSYSMFLYTTITSFILSYACLVAFTTSLEFSILFVVGVMFVVSSIVIFYLSSKRDIIEYS